MKGLMEAYAASCEEEKRIEAEMKAALTAIQARRAAIKTSTKTSLELALRGTFTFLHVVLPCRGKMDFLRTLSQKKKLDWQLAIDIRTLTST